MKEAFVYSWRNKTNGMLYVGKHVGALDDGYVCSSKPMLAEYSKNPDNFERYIIAEGTRADMENFELVLLKAVNAAEDPMYYNQRNTTPVSCQMFSDKHRANISKGMIGKKRIFSEKHKAALSASLLGKKRGPQSVEHKLKTSMAQKGRKHPPVSDATREAISNALLGRENGSPTQETRNKISAATVGKKRSAMAAYHAAQRKS